MEELFKNISLNDIEKLKMLMTLSSTKEAKEIIPLSKFTEEYIYWIKNNRSKSYLESVQLSIIHLFSFFDRQKPINSIQLKEVENFVIHLQRNVKRGCIVYYRNLKAAFNKAKDWGYVSENYFTKIKLPKRQKTAPVFLASNQLTTICNSIKSKIVNDVVWFAFYTGMRLDEIVNLRWKNVDLNNDVITVGDEHYVTKGRNQRFIPISEETKIILEGVSRILESWSRKPGKNDFVFCKRNGDKYTGDRYSREFKKACKAAGMDNSLHFHSLRHSFASNLVQKGVSLYTIKELLGHSSISTTEIYSHLNMDSLREAVEKLGKNGEGQETRSKEKESWFGKKGAAGEEEENILPIEGNPYPSPSKNGKKLEARSERQEKLQAKIFRINSGELK